MSRYQPVDFDDLDLDCSKLKIAIVSARWNSKYNSEMCKAAQEALLKAGVMEENLELYQVPGAYELPVFVKRLSQQITKTYDAILCFATVIRGETLHFEIVAKDSSKALMDLSVDLGLPIINGILACENDKQAKERAFINKENKGDELAKSALALLEELNKIR